MATQYNKETLEITCPAGDTGLFVLDLLDALGNPLPYPLDGYGVFAVAQMDIKGKLTTTIQRPIQIVDNTVTVRLSNALTRKLTPGGEYRWDVRVVTGSVLSDDGKKVCCDEDSDEVHSLFAMRDKGLPSFVVPKVAVPIEGVVGYD
ncbi:MAG: hypothetical protein RSJ41_02630 [Clostridia bacterium]